jgi:hypothetical protein
VIMWASGCLTPLAPQAPGATSAAGAVGVSGAAAGNGTDPGAGAPTTTTDAWVELVGVCAAGAAGCGGVAAAVWGATAATWLARPALRPTGRALREPAARRKALGRLYGPVVFRAEASAGRKGLSFYQDSPSSKATKERATKGSQDY